MEQNLTEKERKQRLVIGIFFALLGTAILFLTDRPDTLPLIIYGVAAGFILNYFTCFCGTKKLIRKIRG